jgi:Fur family peroxide stress response transcriptional regulator
MIINKESLLKERIAQIAQQFRERGYRVTPQRMAIVQAVLESSEHPTAEEVYRKVSDSFPMLSLATVYKTLEMLKTLGEIVEIPVKGQVHYESNLRPHVHLICERCHKVMDWGEEIVLPIPKETIESSGFYPRYYLVEVHGLCSQCQSESNSVPEADKPRGNPGA